jgi:hypothetical protein
MEEAQIAESTERSLLASILHRNENSRHAAARLRAEDFLVPAHQVMYRTMDAIFEDGRGVDALVLKVELAKRGHKVSDAYISEMDRDLPRFYRDVPQWVEVIKAESYKRKIRFESERASLALAKPNADVAAIIQDSHKRLAQIDREHAPRTTAPMFVDALEFISAADKTTDWLVHEIISRSGNGIMCGDPKASKSFGSVDIALSAACGASWMGHPAIKRAKVAIVSREDDPGLTRRRLKKLLRGRAEYADLLPGWLYVNTRQQQADFEVTTAEHMDRLIDELGAFGAELVVLDVFRSLHHEEENDNTAVAKVLSKISRIQQELKCATLLVHHCAKTENPNPFKGLRGASAIHGWMEYGLAISVTNPEADRADYIRRVQFESKECATDDVYYKIVESPDHSTVRLEQQSQPERPKATRSKVQEILTGRNGKDSAAGA